MSWRFEGVVNNLACDRVLENCRRVVEARCEAGSTGFPQQRRSS